MFAMSGLLYLTLPQQLGERWLSVRDTLAALSACAAAMWGADGSHLMPAASQTLIWLA